MASDEDLRLLSDAQRRGIEATALVDAAKNGDPEAFVACDGPYLVHVRDPDVSPPNLAAVQEMSAAIWRAAAGTAATGAELWVDDIRMADPVSEIGMAYALDARLSASGNIIPQSTRMASSPHS